MKDDAPLREHGKDVRAGALVNPDDVDTLTLEPVHPGVNDEKYLRRREELFHRCRHYRLKNRGTPFIDYNDEETRVWKQVSPKLDELHKKHACDIYLKAKHELDINQTEIPQLRTISERLGPVTNIHLVPAEGALPYRTYYEYIAHRGFPVTQFIRHGSHPEFTPEPDMIHDCLGHVPPLMNRDYAEMLVLIARAASATDRDEYVQALKRFSWFSIEFGLIEEAGETKIFGAGILSSIGEIPRSLQSNDVNRRPFVTDDVIKQDYDYDHMQDTLFIAPSFPFLRQELTKLVDRLGIKVG